MKLAKFTLLLAALGFGFAQNAIAADKAALLADALSAAPKEIADNAKVMDWDGNTLQEGNNGYTCFPTPPNLNGVAPMCLDEPWMAWADAWMNKKPFKASRIGTGYMLAGDGGASNIDPYAKGPTDDNDWIVEGPHLMIISPNSADLEGISTDPHNGGPYVMWKGTPYAHIMVPTMGK